MDLVLVTSSLELRAELIEDAYGRLKLGAGQPGRELARPGGLLLVDHATKPGRGTADASGLHRIDEAFARADFEKRGLRVVAKSDLLRRPDDARDQISYKPPMLGKTDKFVLVFRKEGAAH